MAGVDGHHYTTGSISNDGYTQKVKIATYLFPNDAINPPGLFQRIRNSRNDYHYDTYDLPEVEGGLPVAALSRQVRLWPYKKIYHFPKSLMFIPIKAFKECMLDKARGDFKLPSIYCDSTWRVDHFRYTKKQISSYKTCTVYETQGAFWMSKETGKTLAGFKLNDPEAQEIIKNEFYTIPHDENGNELPEEWVSCFVREDVGKLIIQLD